MNALTLNDVRIFLIYLLTGARRAVLDTIDPVRAWVAQTLDPTLAELQALPPETFGGAPNAEQLRDTDVRHDGYGLALLYLALAYKAHPNASPEAKASADLILRKYVPSKSHLRASYATEASRAEALQPEVSADKAALDRLPFEGGQTAHSLATGYVQAGVEIGMLLSGRADEAGARGNVVDLRRQAIADFGILRGMIARAYRRDPARAAQLDRYFFKYLDMLASMRERGSKEVTPPPPPDADPPPPTGV
jgi:hypothetical protein